MTIAAAGSGALNHSSALRPLPQSPLVVTSVTLLILLVFHDEIVSGPRLAAAVTSVVLLLVGTVHRPVVRQRGLTVGLTYLILLGLFHCGLLLPYALSGTVRVFNSRDTTWLYGPVLAEAAWVAAVGIAAFGVGYAVLTRPVETGGPPADVPPGATVDSRSLSLGIVGLVIFSTGLAAWLYWSLQSGALTLGGSYLDYLARTSDKPLPYTYLAMGLGLPMTAAASPAIRRVGLGLFLVWAGPAFLLGLRGEVILPLAAFLVVAARHRRLPLWAIAGGGFGLLSLGAFVRGFRTAGLGTGSINWGAFNPLDGVAELGYSIRPIVTVVGWRATGDPQVGLDTYLNPVLRLLSVLVPMDAPSVSNDPAALSTSVRTRVGPIGGSTIAEAYRAHGLLSLIAVMALVGLTCRILDNLPTDQEWDALVGGVAFILFLWIRNDFVPVPAQILLMLFVVWVASLLPSASPRARPWVTRGPRNRQ